MKLHYGKMSLNCALGIYINNWGHPIKPQWEIGIYFFRWYIGIDFFKDSI
jgi:hypothetical protein